MPARINKGFFTKVKVARDLLRDQADVILRDYLDVVNKARDAGEYETAAKALQWLIEHMPSEDDGTRIIDTSVDKDMKPVVQEQRPAIQIGIQVGGVRAPNELSGKKQKALPSVEIIK
jgi:hypothetical protein